MTDFPDNRRKSLEEAFFAKHNQKLLEELKKKAQAEELARTLAEASGIRDPKLIEHLIGAGVTAESAAALSLVPLVEVAWADGKMEKAERRAVMAAAKESGIEEGSPSHELLNGWLEDQPDPNLLESWKEYVHDLTANLSEEAAQAVKKQILDRAREVARAAGGLMGIAAISFVEEKKLEELERAFG